MIDEQRNFRYYAGWMYVVTIAIITSLLLFVAVFVGEIRKESTYQLTFYSLLATIRQAESAGNDRAIGDSGASRGPYQIKRAYWREATVGTDASDWDYDKWVWNPDRAGYVVYLHWCKVCPEALKTNNLELLARCHRLPYDPWRKDNDDYWRKVQAEMRER